MFADPLAEGVVVVRRQADHREDLAVLRVHHDDDAALEAGRLHSPAKRLLRELLLVGVDRQPNGAAGDRGPVRPEHLHLATGGVALDGLEPVFAAQHRLVRRLDAGATEQVVGLVADLLEVEELAAVDRARVPEHLREQGAELVVPSRLDDHLDAGQLGA